MDSIIFSKLERSFTFTQEHFAISKSCCEKAQE